MSEDHRHENRIIAFDPASGVTGFAVIDVDPAMNKPKLIDAGRLIGSEDPVPHAVPCLNQLRNSKSMAADRRTQSITGDVWKVLTEYMPRWIIVEISSGNAGTGSKRGAKSSLAVYGQAVGAVRQTCEWWDARNGDGVSVIPVTERLWTIYRGDKFKAQLRCRALFPNYDYRKDKGADVADSIGLALWLMYWRALRDDERAAQLKRASYMPPRKKAEVVAS